MTPEAIVRDLDLGAYGLTLWWGAHRHDVGVSSPAGWDSEEGSPKLVGEGGVRRWCWLQNLGRATF